MKHLNSWGPDILLQIVNLALKYFGMIIWPTSSTVSEFLENYSSIFQKNDILSHRFSPKWGLGPSYAGINEWYVL